MKKSKISEILSTFNKYDIRAFNRFLSSPWVLQDVSLGPLFNTLCEDSGFNNSLSKTDIYKKIFPLKKYNDKHFRYLLSALTKGLENFIACQELFKDDALLIQLRMKGLSFRSNEKAYDYEHGLFEKWVRKHPDGDANYYLKRFLTYYQHLNFTYRKAKRKHIIHFDQVMLELDRFYIAKKLQLLAEMENAQNVVAAEYKIHFAEEVIRFATLSDFQEVPVIAVYYHVLLTITGTEQDRYFPVLRKLLKDNSHLFPLEELNDLYQYIRNFCIKKINTGEAGYQSVLFEIYKEILANKRLIKLEYLSQWEFKNITTLGLRLGHLNWVRSFIQKYSYYLRPSERKNAVLYNNANWYFHCRNYSMTLKLFQKVEFTDVYYQLDTRSILLKTYYETGDEEALLFHAAAFKIFIKRNKMVSSYQRTIYSNLINFVVRLSRAGTSRKKLSDLNRQLSENKQIADFQWTRQKLDELS